MTAPRDVLQTTWYGGNNNSATDTRGRVLAVSPGTAAFSHPARVWQEQDGTFAGEWLDDSVKPPVWRRFISSGGRIPAALHQQALAERKGAG